jgi:hypothetical protein
MLVVPSDPDENIFLSRFETKNRGSRENMNFGKVTTLWRLSGKIGDLFICLVLAVNLQVMIVFREGEPMEKHAKYHAHQL